MKEEQIICFPSLKIAKSPHCKNKKNCTRGSGWIKKNVNEIVLGLEMVMANKHDHDSESITRDSWGNRYSAMSISTPTDGF